MRRLKTVGAGVVAPRNADPNRLGRRNAFDALSDQAGAVYDVEADEQTLDTEAVLAALKSGELARNDLVFEGGAWLSLDVSPTFEDAAVEARTRGRGKALFYAAVAVLVPIAAIIAFVIAWILR